MMNRLDPDVFGVQEERFYEKWVVRGNGERRHRGHRENPSDAGLIVGPEGISLESSVFMTEG